MKLSINTHLRRALMTCMSMVAVASLTLPLYAADYEENISVIFPNDSVFSDSSYRYTIWDDSTLIGAVFQSTDLSHAEFYDSTLNDANFSNSDLSNSTFQSATLTGANFTNAIIKGVEFTDAQGLTQDMLKSTASHQQKDFSGIQFNGINMENFDFSGMNLTGAIFSTATITNANFTDSIIKNAYLDTVSMTHDMLKSTASYKTLKDFSGINFTSQNLDNFDFTGMDLSNAYFYDASMKNVTLENAIIKGANLIVSDGLTQDMLKSTASYKTLKDFSGISFGIDLSNFSFNGFNLTETDFAVVTLTNPDFTDANMEGVKLNSAKLSNPVFTNAIIKRVDFTSVTGVTPEMLESTASYKTHKDFSGIIFHSKINLAGFNFSGMNLTDATFKGNTLTGANFTDAIIKGVNFRSATGMDATMIAGTASYKVDKDLSGVTFGEFDMRNFNFTGVDLSNAIFASTKLTRADFTDAIIEGTDFFYTEDVKNNITKSMIMQTASYRTEKSFSRTHLGLLNLQGIDLTGFDLTGTKFSSTDLANAIMHNADLREADMDHVQGYDPMDHTNHIGADGTIHNLSLNSPTDELAIRGHYRHDSSQQLINTRLDGESKNISNGATLRLYDNARLELWNNAQLTLAATGNLDIELDTHAHTSQPSILIAAGSSLMLENNAKLNITLTGDLAQGYDFNLIEWEDPADGAELTALMASGEAFTIQDENGVELALDLQLSADGTSIVLTDQVLPTPPGPTPDPNPDPDPTPTPPVPPIPDIYSGLSSSRNGTAGAMLLNYVAEQSTSGIAPISLMTTRAIAAAPVEPDLAAVLQTLDDIAASTGGKGNSESDRLLAAVAGAGVTSLGSAALSSAEGELSRVLSRSAGLIPAGKKQFWISAQMGSSELDSSGTAAGHSLDSWGGSAGIDWGLKENTTVGFAFTALYGDLDAESVDAGKGELDSYYLSLAATHQSGKWQHRAALSWGLAEASLDRHVSHAGGGYSTTGDTDGYSLSLAYELGYDIKLSETSSVTPIFNATFIHSYLDSYTESGSGAALHVGEQENTLVTLGAGARIASKLDMGIQVGARALIKVDLGDRAQDADVSLTSYPGASARVKGSDGGTLGLELGVGASMPVGEAGAVFLDASADLRDKQQDCNASVGYRMSF